MIRFDIEEPVDVTTVGALKIPTRDPGRAIRFYNRVFGFELVGRKSADGSSRWVMRGKPYLYLAIDAVDDASIATKRLLLETASLEVARERLWNLGVVPADRCIEPRFDPKRCCLSVPLRDPDGNEIELVESRRARIEHVGLEHLASAVEDDARYEALQEDPF